MKDYIIIQAKREIGIQIIFALKAFQNISVKGEGEMLTTFSSIHSFLTHCANISKLLWSVPSRIKKGSIKDALGANLADELKITTLPLLKDKTFRDDLDYYDERMVNWIKRFYPKNATSARKVVNDLSMGTKTSKDTLYLRHYNPKTGIYTFDEHELNLHDLNREILELQKIIGGPILLS